MYRKYAKELVVNDELMEKQQNLEKRMSREDGNNKLPRFPTLPNEKETIKTKEVKFNIKRQVSESDDLSSHDDGRLERQRSVTSMAEWALHKKQESKKEKLKEKEKEREKLEDFNSDGDDSSDGDWLERQQSVSSMAEWAFQKKQKAKKSKLKKFDQEDLSDELELEQGFKVNLDGNFVRIFGDFEVVKTFIGNFPKEEIVESEACESEMEEMEFCVNVVIFDLTSGESFENGLEISADITLQASELLFIGVHNEFSSGSEKVVKNEDAQIAAKDIGAIYFEILPNHDEEEIISRIKQILDSKP